MMVAGDWSVLHPGNHAVVTALDARVKVTITGATDKSWSITTNQGRKFCSLLPPDQWRITDPYWGFACALLQLASRWYPLSTPVGIRIETPPAASYGLGSSAAVCAALAAAIITSASLKTPSREEILRLALVSHVKAQGWRGSGSDCAAAVYGGTISFRSFDPHYLRSAADDPQSWDLLLHDIHSSVRTLPAHPFRDMLPFWTGKMESTRKLVEDTECLFRSDAWRSLAADGESIALTMAEAACEEDAEKAIVLGKRWFYAFNDFTRGRIVSDRMKTLLERLSDINVTSKPSGAGGGDCLVGIIRPEHRNIRIGELALHFSPNAEGVLVSTEHVEI